MAVPYTAEAVATWRSRRHRLLKGFITDGPQSRLEGDADRFERRVNSEFCEEMLDMCPDRVDREDHVRRDG